MRLKFALPGAVVCLLLATSWACAQSAGTSGNISGTVVDPTGAVVEHASIVAVEDDKGIQHNAETDSRGHYRFSGLSPAIYTVTVQSQGFASEERQNIAVVLGGTTTLDFLLQVAAVTSQVQVEQSAGTPMV